MLLYVELDLVGNVCFCPPTYFMRLPNECPSSVFQFIALLPPFFASYSLSLNPIHSFKDLHHLADKPSIIVLAGLASK
jgi:hypothetical protein